MIHTIIPNKLASRDGTGQHNRPLAATDPDYVPVEGRSLQALIQEAQRLAKEIRFFHTQNDTTTDWEMFLVEDAAAYKKMSEAEKQEARLHWAKKLALYVDNPSHFQQQGVEAPVVQPHLALFITFLKLLNHVKAQINGLTKKHLDFYFQERLGLTPKEAVPDVVNVLVTLVEDLGPLAIKKGTVLLAGNDEAGNELHYLTDHDTVVSEATIAQLKTVSVDKHTFTIPGIHQAYAQSEEKAFGLMMCLALGHPNPGDALPSLPAGIDDLLALYDQVALGHTPAHDYVSQQLFLSIEDFNFILETHQQDLLPDGFVPQAVWAQVYVLLDNAHKEKVRQTRQQALQALHETDGFIVLLKSVYGAPAPGNNLPLYLGKEAIIDNILEDLRAEELSLQQGALAYVQDELRLSAENFVELVETSQGLQTGADRWQAVYSMLELAERKVRSRTLPSPEKEVLANVYAESDARAAAFNLSGSTDESVRFKTFGLKPSNNVQPVPPATMGVAITDPILHLEEGTRTITAWVAFHPSQGVRDTLTTLFKEQTPFKLYLSSPTAWFQPATFSMTWGDYIVAPPLAAYQAERNGDLVTVVDQEGAFQVQDLNRYLVWTDGEILRIESIIDTNTVSVKSVGQVDTDVRPAVQKYLPAHIYLHTLQVIVTLQEDELPVLPLGGEATPQFIQSALPALVLSLHHQLEEGDRAATSTYVSAYSQLMDLTIQRVYLQVAVQNLQTLAIQNDRAVMNPKKPFEPFGFEPPVGNSFYVTHQELAAKPLDELTLTPAWVNPPDNFKTYYENYWKVLLDKDSLDEKDYRIDDNNNDNDNDKYFKAQVTLYDDRTALPLGTVALFPTEEAMVVTNIPQKIQEIAPSYRYQLRTAVESANEVLDWKRYFRFELTPLDFQHQVYAGLFAKQALSDDEAIRSLYLNPPYQPKLKHISMGYTAHTEIAVTQADALHHIHPFGWCPVSAEATPYLLPHYVQEGTLYLGIDKLQAPQPLSILFQMAEGSADPEQTMPTVQWHYLKNNTWQALPPAAILADDTQGFRNTGILHLNIPADITRHNDLLNHGLYWLKASVEKNAGAVADTVDIGAQAISATLSTEGVAASHFVNLLSPLSITQTQTTIRGIDHITQPYTSTKGKPHETDQAFYQRISERLRHKDRALTLWDYERMVLEQFPQIYKAKCLPGSGDNLLPPGQVNVIVIPDVVGKLPFNPFQPKVPTDVLLQIHEFLEQRAPAFANISVVNPTYRQVKTRCVVRFKTGYHPAFYKAKLVEEMKQFLAPWAYAQHHNITLGATIYASVLINFIAERPYVAYVANLKLFQSDDGENFIDVRSLNEGETRVVATQPDMILVSALSHEIDVVDEQGYDEANFEGINYMQIELDFEVNRNLRS